MASFLRRIRARVKYWNNAEELAKELDTHRELAAAAFATDGTSDRESRWKAARLLGNTTLAREDARAVWLARWIEELLQDARYAFRTMRREWGFALTASVTLALGIGVLVGVFTVFSAVFIRPWPVRAPSDVFGVSTALTGPLPSDGFGPMLRISYPVWDQIRQSMTTADLAAKAEFSDTFRVAPTGPGRSTSARVAMVSDTFLQTIGIGFQIGGLPVASDGPAIAITDRVWRNGFGSDAAVIGKAVWFGTRRATVTGVLERGFEGFPPREYVGLMLLTQTRDWLTRTPDLLTNPKQCCIDIWCRLRPGHTRAQAAEEISVRANAANRALGLPAITVDTWGTAMASRPGGVKSSVPALFALLFAGCGIVTLLACANIGNLQLVRGLRRSREFAVRLSLGADRSRVIRQLLTESAVLNFAGTVGGLLLAWTVPAAVMSADNSSNGVNYTPDAAAIAFAIALGLLATFLSGLAPAIRVTRIVWRGGASTLSSAGKLRGVLLAAQIALSLSLIASAALLSRGALRAAGGADAGFEFRNINSMVLAATVSADTVAEKAARATLKQAVAAIPGIAIGDTTPWSGISEGVRLTVPGRTEPLAAEFAGFNRNAVTLLEIPLLAGRWYSDDKGLYEAAITRSLARSLWNTEDAIGRTFVKVGEPHLYSVVGLIDEVRLVDTTKRPTALLAPRTSYLPTLLGRPGTEAQLKTIVSAIDPSIRVMSRPLLDGLQKQMKNSFIGISIASGLGLVALLLASFGVFGVFAYVVEERRKEIAVRLALGASRGQVRRSIVAAVRWPVLGGLASGLVFAVIGGFVLRGNLFGLSILDPVSYLMVGAILLPSAAAATFVPLRRAIRVNPAVALRAD